jgi:multiple sugar transport system substrate-binding protein
MTGKDKTMPTSWTFRLALGACLALGAGSAVNAEVTVLGWPGGPEESALRAAADAYNARPEVAEADKVELLFFNRDGFWDKLQADLAAGSTAFDANLIATYSIGRYAPFMEPISLPESAVDVYGEAVLTTMQFEGQQYGVPTDLSLHFLYYRSDLIDELLADDAAKARYAEISEQHLGEAMQPKAPDEWTWDDFAATALYFTQSVNPDSPTRYGTVLQMKNLLFNMMVWHSIPRSHGGNWMDEAGTITVDSDAYRRGLELYKMLTDAGATPRDSLSYEYAEANAAFASGQVAFMLQWNAAAGELTNPDTSPAVAEVTATVAPPAGPEGRFTHIHGLGLGLNKAAENKAGAEQFLAWLATEEGALIYARNQGSPALTPEVVKSVAAERPDLEQLGSFAGQYGFVMNGGTSANALSVYELQAQEFTAYWAGQKELDAALAATAAGMAELLQ